MVFGRNKSSAQTPDHPVKPHGKGRPTPTRRNAEAAARARAKAPRSRKDAARAKREARFQATQRMRTAMRTGDERYYPARDRGPMRRLIRDLVDSRFSFVELLMPMLLVNIVIGFSGNLQLISISNSVLTAMLLVVVVDLVLTRFRVRRELGRRFPGESLKGTTWYAVSRSMQMRFLRMPKPQVRMGQKLPDDYR